MEIGPTYIPNTPTTVYGADTRLYSAHFANESGADVQVTIKDRGTGCNGGACQAFPAVTIPAHTAVVAEFHGRFMPGGITWSATSLNAVNGYLNYGGIN